MSFEKLLSLERRGLVYKIHNEMYNNALSNSGTESRKKSFFLLVKKNKKLSENEKQYCKERFIYDLELNNAIYESGVSKGCNKCRSIRYSDRFCEGCISLQLQSLFGTWTSGNDLVDEFIQKCQLISALPRHILEWIPYGDFRNVTKLTEGGFSSIYTATWTRGTISDYDEAKKEFSYFGPQRVVLKSLNDSSSPGNDFFHEAMNYCKIKSELIVTCYGITKFPHNGNYAMVLNYHPEGNLKDYIQKNHSKLTLKDRVTIFRYLCGALCYIHEKDLIHSDLHSGNILMYGGGCYITDLGLCGPVDEKSSNKIYGIVPYVAPELLRGNSNITNTKESDIYSMGMLFWEIFAGHPPFNGRAHNHHLIYDICRGLQPPILPGMPGDYVEMMQRCWDMDPSNRPIIEELLEFADDKLAEFPKNKNLNSFIKRLFRFPRKQGGGGGGSDGDGNGNGSQQVYTSHPYAYHTSRILDDEISKSKSLRSYKSYTSSDSSVNSLDCNSLSYYNMN